MTDRELMQQALELLNDINQCSLPPTGIPLPAEIDHVTEALQDRLAQPDLAAVGEVGVWDERQWQGFTDEEIQQIEMSASSKLSAIYLAEAQLKGKNAL